MKTAVKEKPQPGDRYEKNGITIEVRFVKRGYVGVFRIGKCGRCDGVKVTLSRFWRDVSTARKLT